MKSRIIGMLLLAVVLGALFVLFGDEHPHSAPSSNSSSGLSIP
jgi:hypothetical protein